MELKIHDFQISILRELLFKPNARFRDLKTVDVTNDHFTFHVNRLIQEGLITKSAGKYSLTTRGKEFANRMDTDSLQLERQAKLAVALHAVRIKDEVAEYLVHRRLKEPFYGWYGSHSGKIRWGETPLDAARREFLEETSLAGDFIHKGIVHYHYFHKDGQLLEDKYFWVYKIENTKGELKAKVPEGENIWMTEKQYRALDNVFATFDETIEVLDSPKLVYLDRTRFVESY
ncbi:MAG: putative NUDIX hydrolase [Microgenomates group bacterium Gr01-1014_16]|nr:MAG: putative NUDIX hydrolase [Microgenomates group bacterium Gr01-1014_16]